MSIDIDTVRAKYAREREKRLRSDGIAQYLRLDDTFADERSDPHEPLLERAPLGEHSTVVCIGGGFSGLVVGARLREAGVEDVRIIDKGGDFGGTWYWNRYPGAQCDTSSFIYLPLLEETGHMPSEKYAHGPEILEHCRRIGKQYDLYERALFHTRVTDLRWQQAEARWEIRTDRGDTLTAQFVVMGIGPLHIPKLPGITGIRCFEGASFHTSRWNYDYTGGDASGAPMSKLADKRVAIIGTGATAVQCVPQLSRSCGELYVVQRTPSSVDVRDNAPTDPDWFATMATPGWQQRWLDNFVATQAGEPVEQDLVMDGWTDISRRIRDALTAVPAAEFTRDTLRRVAEQADIEKMSEIRARVDAVVADHDTAERLKAWYSQLCKRPCFHDEYLDAFNNPHTQLLDTDGRGVERITPAGLVVGGREYPVDCIIYASGFEVGTAFTRRSGYEVAGRDGNTLSAHWAEGMRTVHGVHAHGFPNAFLVQPTQGANLISNVPHNIGDSAKSIAAVVAHALAGGYREVEATAAAEQAWVELLMTAPPRRIGGPDCTPGYYNGEGQGVGARPQLLGGYPAGAAAYFRFSRQWRADGAFAGLAFR